jgi:hypothetical protein
MVWGLEGLQRWPGVERELFDHADHGIDLTLAEMKRRSRLYRRAV